MDSSKSEHTYLSALSQTRGDDRIVPLIRGDWRRLRSNLRVRLTENTGSQQERSLGSASHPRGGDTSHHES